MTEKLCVLSLSSKVPVYMPEFSVKETEELEQESPDCAVILTVSDGIQSGTLKE